MISKKNKTKKNNLSEGQKRSLMDIIQLDELCQQFQEYYDVFTQYQPSQHHHHMQIQEPPFLKKHSLNIMIQPQFHMELEDVAYGSTRENKSIILNSNKHIYQSTNTTDFKDNKTVSQKYQIGCKCKKVECLKLYCQCFAQGKLCGKNCICQNCMNSHDNKQGIDRARLQAKLRLPNSFKHLDDKMPTTVCNCKKSQCKKKYCECFTAGSVCNQFCNCKNCLNCPSVKVETFDRGSIKLKPRKTSVIKE